MSSKMDWKEHYARLYPPLHEEYSALFDTQSVPVKKLEPSKPSNKPKKPKEVDWIAVMKQQAYFRQQQAEQERRAKDIRQVSPPKINETSISSRIFQVLSIAQTPLHINDIISQVEQLGWKSTSQYHKYSQFQHALSDCYYLFEKVDVGTYTLRTAFSDKKPDKPEVKPRASYATNKIATLKDLIADIVNEYNEITPMQVHYSLFDLFGLWLSYSAVWRALQDDRFTRGQNGCYHIR